MDAGEFTQSITGATPLPGWWVAATTGAIALLSAVSGIVPRITRSRQAMFGLTVFSTIVHEAGHALAGCVTGGGVYLIKVYTPDSGLTRTWHKSKLSAVAISAAGYAMPPLAGLGAASLLDRGHAPMVLSLTVAAMILILIVSRDSITVVSVGTVGVVAFTALRWGSVGMQHWVAYSEAWLLLLGETSGLWALVMNRVHRVGGTDDATGLAGKTGVPAVVWIAGWAVLIGWAVWKATPLLWP